MNDRITKLTASIGLFIGGIFGLAGSFANSDSLRCIAWGIDGVGLTIASILLTMYYYRKGMNITAAGFQVFAIGECAILSSNSIQLDAHVSSFAAGTGLWALSLVIISFQKTYPIFIRCTGLLVAVLFSIVSVLIFTSHSVNALSKPMPFFVYPFFVITIFGWAWTLLRRDISDLTMVDIPVS